jgi:hypothetical protein
LQRIVAGLFLFCPAKVRETALDVTGQFKRPPIASARLTFLGIQGRKKPLFSLRQQGEQSDWRKRGSPYGLIVPRAPEGDRKDSLSRPPKTRAGDSRASATCSPDWGGAWRRFCAYCGTSMPTSLLIQLCKSTG